jgi:FtsP/CotA-like multicopper oxidase with cupredoxin domain
LSIQNAPAGPVDDGSLVSVTLVGTDPDRGDNLVYSMAGEPDGALLDADTGAFTWRPNFGQLGTHTITFRVTDGKASATASLTLRVRDGRASPLVGGSLDPLTVPKYVTPVVFPPVMANDAAGADHYEIAVRQFQQQILPGGVWNTLNGRNDAFPPTTVWGYGPEADPIPDSSTLGGGAGIAPAPNSQFNYPAYTVETLSGVPVSVRWVNGLIDPETGHHLPHLLAVDQTLHWANPPQECRDGTPRTDCMGVSQAPYVGPVPMVPHVHGAHVNSHSDGYPEAWWLPAANDIPAGYATAGALFDDATGTNAGNLGYADFLYRNDQPATTLWYHDHTLGMTRVNVYAGPAGFWLIRGGANDGGTVAGTGAAAVLPGPAPAAGQGVLELNTPGSAVRAGIREIPLVIQDRSFNEDGSLFYPEVRAFFEGLDDAQLDIDYAPDSDVLPIWQPEAFFNVMLVNGVSWPKLEVAQARYRFRLLNGCNSRFLNLALFVVDPATGDIDPTREVPFYQIGTEQGFLANVVQVKTGFATALPGDGILPAAPTPAPDPDQALLMALAERADVLVDFSSLPEGTVVRMVNTGPDEPFGGFSLAPTPGDEPVSDPATTGQVMQFVVTAALNGLSATDPTGATPATSPEALVLNAEQALPAATVTRNVSLNEEESHAVCVQAEEVEGELEVSVPITQIRAIAPADPSVPGDLERFEHECAAAPGVAFGPTAALLGTVDLSQPDAPAGIPLRWTDDSGASTLVAHALQDGTVAQIPVTENPLIAGGVAPVEEWSIYNFTADAHPIHLHLVRFQVVDRTLFDGAPSPNGTVQPWELGYKDTVISYPGQITRVRAEFDIAGLYVWHCHIVEHEDNEMMRPFVVSEVP